MRSLQLIGSAALALSLVSCGGGSSSDDVAACMTAMASVACPPGTAPSSRSSGASATEAALSLSGASGSNVQDIGCQYECAPICQCGLGSVDSGGGVICSPCFGAQAQAAHVGTMPNPNPQPAQVAQQPAANSQATVTLNFTAAPLFEHHTLTAPFRPDPFGINVRAGGNQNIADAGVFDPTGAPCRGFVNAAQPDLAITYYSRGTPLLMSVNSEADTTLIVNLPDGSWRCNDDATSSTLNPRLYFPDGQSGRYSVWIGTYQHDQTFPFAQFRATTGLGG